MKVRTLHKPKASVNPVTQQGNVKHRMIELARVNPRLTYDQLEKHWAEQEIMIQDSKDFMNKYPDLFKEIK